MFDNEVAICIKTADGQIVSFFVPMEYVKNFSSLPDEKAIAVEVIDLNGEFGVVALPRRSFEGSNAARVPARALRSA
jgi:hypothetical protein